MQFSQLKTAITEDLQKQLHEPSFVWDITTMMDVETIYTTQQELTMKDLEKIERILKKYHRKIDMIGVNETRHIWIRMVIIQDEQKLVE